jgi:hypothetical protein
VPKYPHFLAIWTKFETFDFQIYVTSADGDVNDEILDDEKKESFLEEDEQSQLTIDKSFLNKNRMKMYEEVPLSVSLYSEVDFTPQGHTVLTTCSQLPVSTFSLYCL